MSNPPPPHLPAYQKPWLSYQDQIGLLQSRGMVIDNVQAAIEFLQHINYYRFSGFCVVFETSRHQFEDGVTFEQVQAACEFDRDLRDLVTEALEAVELDFRAAVAYHFGEHYGPFGHVTSSNFVRNKRFEHAGWTKRMQAEAARSNEPFARHFKTTYSGFPDLPVWVISEIMSFGALSRMCSGMLKPDRKAIAQRYGLQPRDWVSWLHHLNYVRNLCAHHARLWDRNWSIKPQLPAARFWKPPDLPGNNRLFATLLILNYLMVHCPTVTGYAAAWRSRVEALIDQPPSVTNAANLMGLTATWKTHPLWK